MATWLVCKQCGEKEYLQAHTPIVHCENCHEPRYAENDDGVAMLLLSEGTDFTKW